ncbi:hypothetical protein [Vreelandella aquamarina]|uniref:hypothetical protein n=1 Tax=Vreelandella aquamarina TaxID=77097 RepID=UPI0007868080|nr:hypothetical protein [Halomonas axialensis]
MDVEQFKILFGDAQTLPKDIEAIRQLFSDKGIPCLEVSKTPQLNAHSLIHPATDAGQTIIERLEGSPAQNITLVVIEKTELCPDKYERTAIGYNPLHHFSFLFGADTPEENARKEHKALTNKPMGITVYLFAANGLCFAYKRASWQSLVLDQTDEDPFIDDEYDEYDDPLYDEAEEAAYQERQEKEAKLGQELAHAPGWGLCSNHQQRLYFANKFFADRDNVEQGHIYGAVERAKLIFDMEILPEKVAALHKDGKTPKEIAAETGCSQAKAKRIIAQLVVSQEAQ